MTYEEKNSQSSSARGVEAVLREYIRYEKEDMKKKIEEMRNAPPPFSADEKNPMKHIYQNQRYVRALDDIASLDSNPK